MAQQKNKNVKNKQNLGVLIGIWGLIILSAWLIASKKLLINQNPVKPELPQVNPVTVRVPLAVGQTIVQVEVRKTEAEKELGLSYRPAMGADEGMVFVYSQPQKVMYWMKGMRFPLDFIWIARGVVVEITENVSAPTADNPVARTVVPAQDVDMVLEVNAGFVQANNIRVGDKVSWVK